MVGRSRVGIKSGPEKQSLSTGFWNGISSQLDSSKDPTAGAGWMVRSLDIIITELSLQWIGVKGK